MRTLRILVMMELHRHPSGLFYSRQFADYLRQKQADEARTHPGKLLSLEYVRCREGAQAGAAWCEIDWVFPMTELAQQSLRIGETEVVMHRQSKRGLMNRLLHCENGRVVVKS